MNLNFNHLVYLLIAVVGVLLIKSILSLTKRYSIEDDLYKTAIKEQERQEDKILERRFFKTHTTSSSSIKEPCPDCDDSYLSGKTTSCRSCGSNFGNY